MMWLTNTLSVLTRVLLCESAHTRRPPEEGVRGAASCSRSSRNPCELDLDNGSCSHVKMRLRSRSRSSTRRGSTDRTAQGIITDEPMNLSQESSITSNTGGLTLESESGSQEQSTVSLSQHQPENILPIVPTTRMSKCRHRPWYADPNRRKLTKEEVDIPDDSDSDTEGSVIAGWGRKVYPSLIRILDRPSVTACDIKHFSSYPNEMIGLHHILESSMERILLSLMRWGALPVSPMCPHCNGPLTLIYSPKDSRFAGDYGYTCQNRDCTWRFDDRKRYSQSIKANSVFSDSILEIVDILSIITMYMDL